MSGNRRAGKRRRHRKNRRFSRSSPRPAGRTGERPAGRPAERPESDQFRIGAWAGLRSDRRSISWLGIAAMPCPYLRRGGKSSRPAKHVNRRASAHMNSLCGGRRARVGDHRKRKAATRRVGARAGRLTTRRHFSGGTCVAPSAIAGRAAKTTCGSTPIIRRRESGVPTPMPMGY
jgi:hypothetical protein